jgi:hypothetical protein
MDAYLTVLAQEAITEVLSDSHGHTFSELATAVKRRIEREDPAPASFPVIQTTLVAIGALEAADALETFGSGEMFKAVLP